MGFRDLRNINELLIEETIKKGAFEGDSKISSRKLAEICGIDSGTIFYRFNTMHGLLDTAAQSFDRPNMDQVVQMADQQFTAEQIWDTKLQNFSDNPDGTLFYISYTNTFGFDVTANNPRAEEFLRIAKVFFRSEIPLSNNECLFLWDYITSMAFYYGEKFIHHYLPYDDEKKAMVKNVVFGGITHFVKQ